MWPVMHFCGIATVNCSEFDNAFDQYGVIKRQCTKEGAHSINNNTGTVWYTVLGVCSVIGTDQYKCIYQNKIGLVKA